MKLCYVVNQYPKVSHSFIRREILELENQGAEVLRVALRGWEQPVVDPLDVAEQGRTRYVLRQGVLRVIVSALWYFLSSPLRCVQVLAEACKLSRRSDKPLLKHLICLAEACLVARWARSADVRHIHAHFGTNSAEVAMLASRLVRIPFSFTVHGPEEFDHPEGLCLGQKMHHAAYTVAISSYGRSQLYRWAAIADWKKIKVVRCGLDRPFLDEPQPAVPGSTTFLCVGRLCEQKGQLLLIEALRVVIDRGHDCRLVLAGDGDMRAQVEHAAQRLGVSDRVFITGWVSGDRVMQELHSARALVLPSFAEGLPVVLMEALALSKPVITTYVAGIPELVRHLESGWLVPAGDVESLATAMIECLGCDEARLVAMGKSGRDRVLAQHDIRTESTRLLALFRSSGA